MSTELDRLNELEEKLNSSNLLTTEEQQEYNNLFDKLYLVGDEQGSEDDTANFFEAIQKTAQNLFSSASAGVEAIGEYTGSESLDKAGERGQQLVQPALESGKRLKTFDDITDVGDAADWLFSSAFPQVATSIAATLPTAIAGAKIGGAGGAALLGPVGAAVGGIGGGILGAFLPSMLMGAGEISKEIKDRGGDAPGTAIAGGAFMGALDTLSMAVGLRGIAPKLFKNTTMFRSNIDKLVNEAVKRGAPPAKFKTALTHALQGAITEGSIEVTQEAFADWVAQNATDIASPEGELSGRLYETFTLGALGGGAFGYAGGASRAKNVQQNFDALKEVESIEQAAEVKANQFMADEKIDDMIEEQFRTHLLRNNKTDILVSLNKRGLDAAKEQYKQEYIAETKASELAKYAIDGLPEATLGKKTEEKINEMRAFTNQQINDMYDVLKRNVLTKGLAQGLDRYSINTPKDDVDIESKRFQLARNEVMNEYIQLADIGIADENRLLSSPALFQQYLREGESKDIRQLIEEHKVLFPTGVGTEAGVQEQNRNKMSKADLNKQIAEKRFKLANTFENLQIGKEESFFAPESYQALQNIWVNEIGRSRERIVDPLSGKVTAFTVQLKNSNNASPVNLTFEKRVDTKTTSKGEKIPTSVEYIATAADGAANPEAFIGKTFEDMINTADLKRYGSDFDYRLDPKNAEQLYGPTLELVSYVGKVNQNINYDSGPQRVLQFLNYLFRPRGAKKSEAFFELERKKIGRLRAIGHRMAQLAHAYDTAVVNEVLTGDKTYQEINNIGMDFLTNTQQKMFIPSEYQQQLIKDINNMDTDTTFTNKQKEEVLKKIRSGKDEIVGPRTNILDLPENIRAPLVAMRTNIDILTQRIKDEIPKSILQQELNVSEIVPSMSGEPKLQETTMTIDEIMSKRLGSYVTDQYKMFDTGYNPFSFWEKWWGTKKIKDVKARAIKAIKQKPKILAGLKAEAKRKQTDVDTEAMLFLENLTKGHFNNDMGEIYDPGGFVVTQAKQEGVDSPVGKLLETKGSQMIPEVRELFGLYDNPAQLAGITVGKLSNLVENYAFFNRLLETDAISGQKIFSPVASETFDTKVPLLNTPLDGFYTTKEMADALNTAGKDRNAYLDIYRSVVLFPKALAQAGKTVFSPMAQARNAFTASFFYMANGHYFGNPREWKEAFDIVLSELGAKGVTQSGRITFDGKQAQKIYARMQELGVVNTNTVLGELLANMEDSVRLGIDSSNAAEFLYWLGDKKRAMLPLTGKDISMGNVRGNVLIKGPQRLYQASDDYWKVLSFIAEKRKLENMWSKNELTELGNFAKEYKGYQTGSNKYEDIIEHIAAYNVRHTIPNYDYIGRAGNFIRQTPLGNFIAFPIEIMRTSLNIISMGKREAFAGLKYNKPELTRRGLARMISYGTMMYGIPATVASMATAMAENDTSDEDGISDEQMLQLRRLVPDYAKYNYLAPLSLKDGKFSYYDLSHLAVYDMVAQMVDTAIATYPNDDRMPGEATERVVEQLFGLFEPFGEPSIYTQTLLDIMNNQKNTFRANRGGDITKEKEFGERFSDYADYFWDSVQPGILTQGENLIKALPDAEISFNKYGRKQDFAAALQAFSGLKVSETDIKTTIPFKFRQYQREENNARNIFDSIYQSGAISEQELKEEFIRSNKALFNAQKELFLDVRAALDLGVDAGYIEKQNKERTVFGTKTEELVYEGMFEDRLDSKYERFMNSQFTPSKVPEGRKETYEKNTEEIARTGNLTGIRNVNWSKFEDFYNQLAVSTLNLQKDWDSQTEELVSKFLAE